MAFVRHGLIRSYSLKAGKEVSHAFYQENTLFYDNHSFLSGQTCKKTYEALENGELFFIDRKHLHSLYERHKSFERLGRLAVEHAIKSMERINHGTAGEGYGHLLVHHKGLLERVLQKLIASFLSISQN
ncbi:Crp/Fnr family transcriptional regulator [Flagellimonas aurea]|uniref:Crp/Fnr family transcriptional regulator n=1 Tax=Flagellimonas aurea TaxID=2915619 RepID=UPI0035CF0241